MKKSDIFATILILASLSLVMLTGCSRSGFASLVHETFVNDPDTVERIYNAGSFDGIDAESIVEVILSRGNSCTVKVRSSKAFLDRLQIRNKGGRLHLYMKDAGMSNFSNKKCLVFVTMPEIREIELEGAALLKGVKGRNRFESDRPVSISTEGASKISDLFIKSPSVKVESEGASKIFDLVIHASNMVDISSEGASSIGLSIFGGNAEVSSEGASKVYLRGRMNQTRVSSEGASKIFAKDLKTVFTSVRKEGVSSMELD